MSLKIKPIKTSKSKIKQRPLAKAGIIPKHSSVCIFQGSQGSGKSTLVVNLLKEPQFYGKKNGKPYFDEIILFTNSDDDIYDELIKKKIIKKNLIKFNPSIEDVRTLVDHQNSIIKKVKDISKAPRVLVIYEDIVSSRRLLRSEPFLETFCRPRHLNFSVWLLTQYLNIVPKSLRMQANHIFAFQGNKQENEILVDHFTPAASCKKCFDQIILDATRKEPDDMYPFLHICKKEPVPKRFRRNLDTYLQLKCPH